MAPPVSDRIRLFLMVGSAGQAGTTTETTSMPPRANADAAMPASRGLKHETCFLTDPANPRADEGTSNLIHIQVVLGVKGDLNLNSPQVFSRSKTWRP